MNAWMWTIIATHQVIGLVTGETGLRYFQWGWAIRKQEIALKPLIVGIVIISAAAFALQVQYLSIQLQPDNLRRTPLSYGSLTFEITRMVFIIGFAYLTYPISVMYYRQSWRAAMVDLSVRLFLIAFSFVAGVACAFTYVYGHMAP